MRTVEVAENDTERLALFVAERNFSTNISLMSTALCSGEGDAGPKRTSISSTFIFMLNDASLADLLVRKTQAIMGIVSGLAEYLGVPLYDVTITSTVPDLLGARRLATDAVACQLGGEEIKCSQLPNVDGEGCDYYQTMTWDCTACHNCPGGWIKDGSPLSWTNSSECIEAAVPTSSDGISAHRTHCYRYFPDEMTHQDATTFCEEDACDAGEECHLVAESGRRAERSC